MKEEEKSNPKNRLDQLLEFEKEEPGDLFIKYGIALEYLKLGETQKSVELLLAINDLDTNYLPVYYQLGKIYEMRNETEQAIEIYKSGIEVAKEQKNHKTYNELREAMEELE